jgi:hypothetical protein
MYLLVETKANPRFGFAAEAYRRGLNSLYISRSTAQRSDARVGETAQHHPAPRDRGCRRAWGFGPAVRLANGCPCTLAILMNLLEEKLPNASISADVSPSEFLARCELVAKDCGWNLEREPDADHIFIHPLDDLPIQLGIAAGERLEVDVSAPWTTHPTGCQEYVEILRYAFAALSNAYAERYGPQPRLYTGRCSPEWDRAAWNGKRLERVRWKFRQAVEDLAIGPGDAPARLRTVLSARDSILKLKPDDLPPPLRHHWCWIKQEVTRREPVPGSSQGKLDATLSRMRKQTGAKIAERILAIAHAIDVLSGVPWDQ